MKHLLVRRAVLLPLVLLVANSAPVRGQESAWPKVLSGEKGEILVYQPQLESLEGNRLEARSAVSVKMAGESELVFGAIWLSCDLSTDQETRMATLERVRITATRFPDVDEDKVEQLSRYLEQEIPEWDLVFSIDQLVASLDGASGTAGVLDALNDDPPVIFQRTVPTVLVLVDGDPILADLEGYELKYVVNSAFFIVQDKTAGTYFLRGAGMWFSADDLDGTWAVAADLPTSVVAVSKKIEEDEQDQAGAQEADAENLALVPDADEAPPEIILSTVPAELIVTAGEPDFASVEGTQLLYLKNTESDVLMDIASQNYFLLISGRWYQSGSLDNGPWQYVDFEDLPPDFAVIPSDSDMGNVLASVAGTQEAQEALLETQIPQTAEVDRATATCEVSYDGDPEFQSCVEGVSYAINTDKPVLLIDGKYYCVDSAVWFISSGPSGPWQVATEVPAVVQELPADCPVYNVKYVYIYESTPEVVYTGYTSGYHGYYASGPCVVYGTGYHYAPWWGNYYYPRPVTYGFGVHYNPYSGWGFTFGISYGWLNIGVGWGRPLYGGWGPGGYRYGYRHGYWRGYNHGYRHGYRRGAGAGYRAGYRAGQKQPRANTYRDRKDGVKRTGDVHKQPRQSPSNSDRRNNVYADRAGNVHRDNDGKWEQRDSGGWRDRSDASRDGDRPENREQRDQSRDGAESRQRPENNSEQNRQRDQQARDQRQGDQQPSQMQRDKQRNSEQGVQRQRDQQRGNQQQLDRDRSSRQRGSERQRQAPQRQRSAPQRSRGGGRRG